MNPNLQRALLLYQQSRYDLAEEEIRQALAADPHDSYSHALMALCLLHREQFDDATQEARQAVHLAPDFPFAHYVHAQVLHDRHRNTEALEAINAALRLDSSDADLFALLSAIHLDEKRWTEALDAAQQGLLFDSEHVGCTNLRAIALVRLGRKAEAGQTIDTALARNPDNAVTHANQGWTLLEKGDSKKALEHFREALRLDPGNDWARAGVVEALKARHFIYAWMLRYFLWMSRLSTGAQWGIILGGYFGNRILASVAKANPDLSPWITPIRIVYITFAVLTWTADPIFNLLLRLNRFGRLALSREQVIASNWIGACLLLAIIGLAGCVWFGVNSPWLILAIVCGLLVLPIAGTFKCQPGWPRTAMAVYSGFVALIGIAAIALFASLEMMPQENTRRLVDVGQGLVGLFALGVVGSMWIANILVMQRPTR